MDEKESTIEEREFKYDIYIAGVWERYCSNRYKEIIEESLPTLRCYDPEIHQDGDFFPDDLDALSNSEIIVANISDFTMQAIGFEIGYIYSLLKSRGYTNDILPTPNVILIWDPNIISYGRRFWERVGIIVETPQEAVVEIKKYFNKYGKARY